MANRLFFSSSSSLFFVAVCFIVQIFLLFVYFCFHIALLILLFHVFYVCVCVSIWRKEKKKKENWRNLSHWNTVVTKKSCYRNENYIWRKSFRHQYNKIEIGVFFFHETGVIRRETENKRDCLSRLIAFCNHWHWKRAQSSSRKTRAVRV